MSGEINETLCEHGQPSLECVFCYAPERLHKRLTALEAYVAQLSVQFHIHRHDEDGRVEQ